MGRNGVKFSEVDIPKSTRASSAPGSSLDFILYMMGRNSVLHCKNIV